MISAQNLPKVKGDKKDIVDPYVAIKVHGHPADVQEFKTKVVDDNGIYLSIEFTKLTCLVSWLINE